MPIIGIPLAAAQSLAQRHAAGASAANVPEAPTGTVFLS